MLVLVTFESVARNRCIDFEGPAVDATSERVGFGEALASKKLRGLKAAHAVVTVDYDGLFGVLKEILEHRLEFTKRCVD